jgi:hypothetical protein
MPIYIIAGIIVIFPCNLKEKSFKDESESESESVLDGRSSSFNLRAHHQSYVVSLKKNPP